MGFNVVDYDKKIDVSKDSLLIYVYLSHSLLELTLMIWVAQDFIVSEKSIFFISIFLFFLYKILKLYFLKFFRIDPWNPGPGFLAGSTPEPGLITMKMKVRLGRRNSAQCRVSFPEHFIIFDDVFGVFFNACHMFL